MITAWLAWLAEPCESSAVPTQSVFELGIIGASGYAGQVLHALAMQHPCMQVVVPEARSPEDAKPGELERLTQLDAIALALPHEPAAAWTAALLSAGARRVLDLSDARRRDPEVHYGLPELFGAPPAEARLVANPGCYPTATLLALVPLLRAGLIEPNGIAVLGTSGASGAGKALADRLHFCNLAGNSFPYKVGSHRHVPEIEAKLGAPISFVTQLLPIVRGMLVTCFVRPRASSEQLAAAWREAYAAHPWVSVLDTPEDGLGLAHVVGSHQALLAIGPVERSGLVPVFSSIDNLMRGAASLALHNLNLWLGLDAGLGLPAAFPRAPAGVPPAFATRTRIP